MSSSKLLYVKPWWWKSLKSLQVWSQNKSGMKYNIQKKFPFTFQELPKMSVHNYMKTSVQWKLLDLTGTTSTQQEKRWIGDSEGHHCLCVCFWCLQRRPLFLRCHLRHSKKGLHCLYVQAPREWSLCWGVNDNTIWTSHTAFLSWFKVLLHAPRKTRA